MNKWQADTGSVRARCRRCTATKANRPSGLEPEALPMPISNAKFDPSPRPLARKKGVGERQPQPLQVDEKEAEKEGAGVRLKVRGGIHHPSGLRDETQLFKSLHPPPINFSALASRGRAGTRPHCLPCPLFCALSFDPADTSANRRAWEGEEPWEKLGLEIWSSGILLQ